MKLMRVLGGVLAIVIAQAAWGQQVSISQKHATSVIDDILSLHLPDIELTGTPVSTKSYQFKYKDIIPKPMMPTCVTNFTMEILGAVLVNGSYRLTNWSFADPEGCPTVVVGGQYWNRVGRCQLGTVSNPTNACDTISGGSICYFDNGYGTNEQPIVLGWANLQCRYAGQLHSAPASYQLVCPPHVDYIRWRFYSANCGWTNCVLGVCETQYVH